LQFATALDKNFLPVNPATVFQNPVGHLYAQFTYDKMTPKAQWSALWYFGNQLVHYETNPWDGGTGGVGYTDWNPDPSMWLTGEYEIQIFVGESWKTSGRFTVEGQPPTAAPSATPTFTPTSTRTLRPSDTHVPSQTPTPRLSYFTPTLTPQNTHAPTPTITPITPTSTHAPTYTNTPATPSP
jgi:hypothetical protein